MLNKIKTTELTGVAIDWAVAKCEGLKTANLLADGIVWLVDSQGYISRNFNPSSNWTWGGPIIEREHISIEATRIGGLGDRWMATSGDCAEFADTPLIAAMRCYVASKLGDEIEIPKEVI